ncbi:MAG: hypothetical protein GX028_01850 [Clostridiaceae bacterium]|nr:hypothetical protein [Clostridiaceae bacterium]
MTGNNAASATHLERALETVRKRLPVPSELATRNTNDEKLLSLIEKLDQVDNTSDVIRLAHTLKVSELRYVFPALNQEKAQSKKIQDRLFILIRERACYTMYNTAWNCFQQTPDDQVLQRALALLCSILQIKQETSQEMTFSNILRPVSNRKDKSNQDLKLGTLPLISDLAAPDNKSFTKRLSIVLAERGYEIQTFFHDYGILPDSVLAADLISQSFLNRQHYTLRDLDLFRKSLQQASSKTQIELVESLLTAVDMQPDVFDEYCKIIYQKYGGIDEGNMIWQDIREAARAVYRHWLITAAIRTHCRTNPAKSRFYRRYFDFINSVRVFSDETLLIYFDSFVLADNRKSLDTAIYYGNGVASEHPLEIDDETEMSKDPASQSTPHISCEQAISSGNTSGIVILYFNQAQIKYSGAFIDFCLQQNRGTIKSIKRRIFG